MITTENVAEVLPRFFGTSKRDAQEVVAELAPRPAPARTIVTAIRSPPLELAFALHDPSGRPADCVRANAILSTQEDRSRSLLGPSSSRRRPS